MDDQKVCEIQGKALFDFQMKFSDWHTGYINLSGREMKAYIKAVQRGQKYEPPSTDRASQRGKDCI